MSGDLQASPFTEGMCCPGPSSAPDVAFHRESPVTFSSGSSRLLLRGPVSRESKVLASISTFSVYLCQFRAERSQRLAAVASLSLTYAEHRVHTQPLILCSCPLCLHPFSSIPLTRDTPRLFVRHGSPQSSTFSATKKLSKHRTTP